MPQPEVTPVERIQTLRLSVRLIWWVAVALTVLFGGGAMWMGFVLRDPFALFFAVLAGLCAVVGYGAVSAIRRRPPPSS